MKEPVAVFEPVSMVPRQLVAEVRARTAELARWAAWLYYLRSGGSGAVLKDRGEDGI